MEDAHFNVIFNEDLNDDYKNIMDRVVDHINYWGDDDNDGLRGDGDDGENDDDNNDDDDDNDDDSDKDGESFWSRDFDMKNDLETKYKLKPSRRMSVVEKMVIFLYTIALGASNREVQ
ncbi:uncharacterized protein LOC133702747 [Populus nigra]|uniref:uncharacterized protein LOC133702747 n=1 Tax=Populus nigra TaxID=3691 RepID=UPI002B26D9E5|nr:uncharacterized protein LOC133702747 [Populus nigra]